MQQSPTLVTQKTPDGWKIVAFQNTVITQETASTGNNLLAAGVTTALNDAIAEQ
jgi:hypothetical protein